jgi:hypothetical protein
MSDEVLKLNRDVTAFEFADDVPHDGRKVEVSCYGDPAMTLRADGTLVVHKGYRLELRRISDGEKVWSAGSEGGDSLFGNAPPSGKDQEGQ